MSRIVTAAVLAFALWLAWALALPIAPPQPRVLIFPPGSPTGAIAAKLQREGVIRSRLAFKLLHYAQPGHKLKAGEYNFELPANAFQIFQRMVRGEVVIHTVVIPEGYNIFEIAEAIQSAGLGSKQDFLRAATQDTDLVQSLDPQARSLEGYLFPDTYRFSRGMTMREIAAVMVHRFRKQEESLGLGTGPQLHRLLTLASIVEKETANPAERAEIAGVYDNRLARNMNLAADPTVAYAAMLRGDYRGTIYESDLQADSPYNTYKVPGLPPGPICNPGVASLRAAQNPMPSDYLYFVAKGDGSGRHHFSSTYEQHERNVAEYRRTIGER